MTGRQVCAVLALVALLITDIAAGSTRIDDATVVDKAYTPGHVVVRTVRRSDGSTGVRTDYVPPRYEVLVQLRDGAVWHVEVNAQRYADLVQRDHVMVDSRHGRWSGMRWATTIVREVPR